MLCEAKLNSAGQLEAAEYNDVFGSFQLKKKMNKLHNQIDKNLKWYIYVKKNGTIVSEICEEKLEKLCLFFVEEAHRFILQVWMNRITPQSHRRSHLLCLMTPVEDQVKLYFELDLVEDQLI